MTIRHYKTVIFVKFSKDDFDTNGAYKAIDEIKKLPKKTYGYMPKNKEWYITKSSETAGIVLRISRILSEARVNRDELVVMDEDEKAEYNKFAEIVGLPKE